MNMKAKIFITAVLICLAIILMPIIMAETGCCYDGSQGICSLNADKNNCISGGGNWTSDATCNAETKCAKGCCIAGNVVAFTTDRRCTILSSSYGVVKNFNSGMTESQCHAQSQTGIDGACVFGEDQECKITNAGNCSGEFHSGVSCTDINTKCKKTSNTTCYKEDVYSIDSCGNPDKRTSDCDYSAGTICRKEANVAFCKSLNCAEGKSNGQSWCVGIGEEGAPVGSRYFRKYCLNGEIFTEPCADFRAETCVAGESATAVAKCMLNDWSSCLDVKNDSKKCGELDQCIMWGPGNGDCVITGSGNIYCGFENKFYKMNGTRDSMTKGEEVTERDIVLDVDASGGEHFTGKDNLSGGKMIDDLNLKICVPKVAGGLEFYPKKVAGSSGSGTGGAGTGAGSSSGGSSSGAGGISTATEICGKGNYESEINFEEAWGCYFYITNDDDDNNYWGNLGLLINASNDSWVHNIAFDNYNQLYNAMVYSSLQLDYYKINHKLSSYLTWGCIRGCGGPWICEKFWKKSYKKLPVSSEIVELLNQRCQAIGDCGGKANWVGMLGAEVDNGLSSNVTGNSTVNGTNGTTFFATRTTKVEYMENDNYRFKFLFNFTCAPYKAPVGDEDCGKCGADKLACSEYRCKALGQKCAYYEPQGVQTGICQSSDDNEPPKITLSIEPASPIRPNTAVKISALTDERAECKFDIGVAGTKFSEMTYNFIGSYTLVHNVTLNIPGQKDVNNSNDSEGYALINRDGKYDVYVRCSDAVGNWNLRPELLTFEVMKTPDLLAPILSNFNPESGSRITYGKTEKIISFKINEPAECKWSFDDQNFSEMEKNFDCDDLPSDEGLINGYSCSGKLTNITQNITGETTFYIRCKDQVWLEGKEDDLYRRNTNEQSVAYVLKPSPELWIRNITPIRELKVSGSNMTTILKVITSDGSNNGISECYWSQSSADGNYAKFFNTNAIIHTQTINILEGVNTFYVGCRDLDSKGNEINRVLNSTTFNVIIDTLPPAIILSYVNNQTKQLTLVTDEPAECRYTLNNTIGCSFEFSNGTSMRTTDKIRHSASGFSGMYYVKCKDELGFVNTDTCGIIVKV